MSHTLGAFSNEITNSMGLRCGLTRGYIMYSSGGHIVTDNSAFTWVSNGLVCGQSK